MSEVDAAAFFIRLARLRPTRRQRALLRAFGADFVLFSAALKSGEEGTHVAAIMLARRDLAERLAMFSEGDWK